MNERDIKRDEVQSLAKIFQEFKNGFDYLKKYPKTVSIFGSARFPQDNPHCRDAETLAKRIVTELQYAVMTGGGPGIMMAANKGAHDANGLSLGVTIKLPKEQRTNIYVIEEFECTFFFTRRTLLNFAAEAYVAFPGGYGTLDELFERITLIQNGKIPKVPMILVGSEFWNPLVKYIKEVVFEKHNAITKEDLNIFTVTDDLDEVIDIIKKAPVSRWWRHIEN